MRFNLLSSRCAAALLMAGLASTRAAAVTAEPPTPGTPHTLRVNRDHFELDGKPFQIISGAVHYERVPRAYWRDRLRKAKAMGLNTVETYVFWNWHEAVPGQFDFTGEHDVAEFIREAQQEGLFVLLRPGPYSCAEWDFGGYPAWLLQDPAMKVRENNPAFLAAAQRWLKHLGAELAPLQSPLGGPILAVQVENEYGSFGSDHAYMRAIRDQILDAGFDKAMLYTADGADELERGSLPELPAVINFGSGEAKPEFAKLAKLRPHAPMMCGEYWDGWFDHWGEKHHTTNPAAEAKELEWILRQGYSINLYMLHGGTSFGWMAGANIDDGKYDPDVTSYDYDVPVGEQGELRDKFYLFRNVIRSVMGVALPEPPAPMQPQALGEVSLTQTTPLWQTLPTPVFAPNTLTMEQLGQSYGYILYETNLSEPVKGPLIIDQLHSYAQVYVDQKLVATLDRRKGEATVQLEAKANSVLRILVENTGRVNFGPKFPQEQAGITRRVTLNGNELNNWRMYSLPMDAVSKLPFRDAPCQGACFARGSINIEKPADTFLDMRGFSHGMVFVNGRALGRFWRIGPQRTLYLPAPWLHAGQNDIVVFDLDTQSGQTLRFIDHPILDGAQEDRP